MNDPRTFPATVDCPVIACVWQDDPEHKGNCLASYCPFTQATRDRWFNLQAEIERKSGGEEINFYD